MTRSMMLVLLAGTGSAAFGQTLTWQNAAGGSAGTAGNWSPAQIPTATSALVFNLAATYPVSFPVHIRASAGMDFTRGNQTISTLLPHRTGNVTIGSVNAASDTVTVTTGVLTGDLVQLGTVAGAAGFLVVDDADARLNASMLRVGALTSQLCRATVTGGGQIDTDVLIVADRSSTTRGDIRVSGEDLSGRSTLTAPTMVVGATGFGSMAISAGGHVISADAWIGKGSTAGVASRGEVLVGGSGRSEQSRLEVEGNLNIGRNDPARSDAGRGLLDVQSDGVVTVTETLTCGSTAGGEGIVRIREGAQVLAGSFVCDRSGELDLEGTLSVRGGRFVPSGSSLAVSGPGAGAQLFLEALTAPVTVSVAAATDALVIGVDGRGLLDVSAGTRVNIPSGDVTLGALAGSSGRVLIDGSTLDIGQGRLWVGKSGEGLMTAVESTLSVGSLVVGQSVIDGPDPLLTIAGDGAELLVRGGRASASISPGPSTCRARSRRGSEPIPMSRSWWVRAVPSRSRRPL